MESMTDCAFSWPISERVQNQSTLRTVKSPAKTYVDSSLPRCGGGSGRCCAPSERSSSRASGRHRSSRLDKVYTCQR